MNVLAGDIGGTKTWLQIADCSSLQQVPNGNHAVQDPINQQDARHASFSVVFERRYDSAQYSSFDSLLGEFFNDAVDEGVSLPELGCIGVAGPVDIDADGVCVAKVTNLPWWLDTKDLASKFSLQRLHLINDFEAVAYGIAALNSDEILVIQAAAVPKCRTQAPQVVIGAGTGLGQAMMVWCGDAGTGAGYFDVITSEGGHADFAPGSNEQRDLLCFLGKRQSRVCVEDVLSGHGLVNVYQFFADKYPRDVSESLQQAMALGDAAAAISEAALSGSDSLADRALRLFVEIYGTQAGNLALTCVASGGVYIAGGIAPKIRERFSDGVFLKAFADKGPMQDMMKKIPVKLVLNPQVGLKGAALVASRF